MTKAHHRPLSERTAHAGIWTVGGKLFAKSLDFISLLVLARFLGPGEFGVVAMAMTAVQIVEALCEMPLGAVLMSIEKPSESMYDTAFTMAVIRSVVTISVLAALSVPLSIFYHEPRLIALQCALAFAPAMRGLVSQRLVEFTRMLDFRRDVALEVFGKIGALIIATTLAVTTGSYWAIAIGTISTTAVMMAVSYLFAPQRLRFTLVHWRMFADMVGWNAAGQVVSAINWQTDKVVLPRFVDTMTFGRFTSADNLIAVPVQAIIVPISRPLFAAFMSVRDTGGIERIYLKASIGIFSLVGPILMMIAFLSHPIIHLILGPRWEETAIILTWLAFAAIALLPTVVLPSLAMAINKTRMAFIRNLAEFSVKVPLILIGAWMFHLQGVLVGHAISSVLVFFSCLVIVKILIGLPVRTQLISLLRPAVAMAPAGLFLYVMAKEVFVPGDPLLYTALSLAWVCASAEIIFVTTNLLLWKLAGCPEGCESLAIRIVKKTLRIR
ncbi:MAG: oligosaccharide flippase family protein [Asticcacaulis sp.]|nr:oligosaccharide flippase family protein [Asticcacaulis sp.]